MSDARPRTGLDLSLVQVVAGTGAALTAALLGSLFGIAGTLLGTAVGSTVGTVCTAVYTHQLRRTRARLHQRVRVPVGGVAIDLLALRAVASGAGRCRGGVRGGADGPDRARGEPGPPVVVWRLGGHRGGTVRAPRWAAPSPHRTYAPTIQFPTVRRRCPCPARQRR